MSRMPTTIRAVLLAAALAVPALLAACSPGTNGATDNGLGQTNDPSMLDVSPSPSDDMESESESPS
jgi:hypothetical protein